MTATVITTTSSELAVLGRSVLDLPEHRVKSWLASATREEREVLYRALDLPEVRTYAQAREFRTDPAGWLRWRTGEFMWSAQERICASVVANRRTAVPSCHSAGKSWTAGRLVAWWIDIHPPGDVLAITTAPTFDQVRAILWKEINRVYASGHLPGRTNLSQWYVGNELVAFGRKPADLNPTSFQGHHATNLLIVIDEADGVAAPIWDGLKTLGTGKGRQRMIAIGNPDSGSGPFFDACQPGSDWHVERISAFDTPNFTGEEVPEVVADNLVSQTWVDEFLADLHGDEAHPLYLSKVLALAPKDNPQGVVPWSKIVACIRRDPDEKPDREGAAEAGIDIGAGGDLTVCWTRQGDTLLERYAIRTADPEEAVNGLLAFLLTRDYALDRIKIDANGPGWGLVGGLKGGLRHAGYKTRVVPVMVGEASAEPNRYANLRAEIWWRIARGYSIEGTWDLRVLDPSGPEVAELIAPTFELDRKGRILIEKKDDLRSKLGRSPDDADAILLAYYNASRGKVRSGARQARETQLPSPI